MLEECDIISLVIVMDIKTTKQRSANMKAVKSKDTKIEVLLRKALWHHGIRYRKNYKICNCKPDIVITKSKIAIFCDGDFWHGKDTEKMPQNNARFWLNKISRNKERDLENTIALRDAGWTVLRFWESDILANLNGIIIQIINTHKKAINYYFTKS